MLRDFKSFILNEKLILENRISDLEKKYSKMIPKNIINYFKENDFTYNKAYFEWMLNAYSLMDSVEKEKIEELKIEPYKWFPKIVKKFDDIKQSLDKDDRNITKYRRVSQLYNVVINKIKDYDTTSIENSVFNGDYTGGGVDIHVNNNEWLIFTPYSFSVAEEYGHNDRGGKNWCVCYDKDYFYEYFCPDGAITMIINKLDYKKDIALQKDNNEHIYIWDYNDENVLNSSNSQKNDIVDFLSKKDDFEFVVDWIMNNDLIFPDINMSDVIDFWVDEHIDDIEDYLTYSDYSEYFDYDAFTNDIYDTMSNDEEYHLEFITIYDLIDYIRENSDDLGIDVDDLDDLDEDVLKEMIDWDVFFDEWFDANMVENEMNLDKYISDYYGGDYIDYIDKETFMRVEAENFDEAELIKYYYMNK